MTKQITREQLNQLLEQEVDRYIQEEYMLTEKIDFDLLKRFVENLKKNVTDLDRVKNIVKKSIVTGTTGTIAYLAYALVIESAKYVDYIQSKLIDSRMTNLEYIKEFFPALKDHTEEFIKYVDVGSLALFGFVVFSISIMFFTLFSKGGDKEKAKKQVYKTVQKSIRSEDNEQVKNILQKGYEAFEKTYKKVKG